jgi:hypothetical protein
VSESSDRLAEDLKLATLTGPARVLAQEAVRIASRLDSLDGWIRGSHKSWYILGDLLDGEVSLVINAPLGEARQQALALRAVLESLAKLTDSVPVAPPASKADELKKKREERRAAATKGTPGSAIVDA